MKATKQESIIMEGRTLRRGLVNVFNQRHQFSRELRHLPTVFVMLILGVVALVIFTPSVEAPTSCICPAPTVCDLPKTGSSISL